MIDIRIKYSQPVTSLKDVLDVRFVDRLNDYDKMFSLQSNATDWLIKTAEYQITCILCAEDYNDINKLNQLFGEREFAE